MAYSSPSTRTTGEVITAAIWNQDVVENVKSILPTGISIVIDGGGAEVTTGSKRPVVVPAKCDISSVSLLADQTGSMVVDIWKDTYANYPPTDADSITSATPLTISSNIKATDSTLSGWTTALDDGDILLPNVDSCTTITWAVLYIKFARS
jgi:hypothetical protein